VSEVVAARPMTDLVPASTADLPPLEIVEARVFELVSEGAVAGLDEARRQAEAHSLYERRSQHLDRALYYRRLKLLTEAALGVISLDDPDAVPKNQRHKWRVLASALERGHLVEMLNADADERVATTSFTWKLENGGYWFAPGEMFGRKGSIRWDEARILAREAGIALASVPPDPETVERRNKALRQRAWKETRRQEAYQRLKQMERRQKLVAVAKHHGPNTEKAASLLRQLLQAAHEMQTELPPRRHMDTEERESFDGLFYHLHKAEDEIAVLLGLKMGRAA
jgi:hypothetical protein